MPYVLPLKWTFFDLLGAGKLEGNVKENVGLSFPFSARDNGKHTRRIAETNRNFYLTFLLPIQSVFWVGKHERNFQVFLLKCSAQNGKDVWALFGVYFT